MFHNLAVDIAFLLIKNRNILAPSAFTMTMLSPVKLLSGVMRVVTDVTECIDMY